MKYTNWLNRNIPSLEGKIYIVTGANSGIGFYTTMSLAYMGAKVIMACRNLEKANKAKEEILSEVPNANLVIEEYDQASFKSIKEFVNKIKQDYVYIDGLVCNAGVYFSRGDYKTKDGYELTLGTNYLGTYKLIKKMSNYLGKNNARVVLASSFVASKGKNIPLEMGAKLKKDALYNYSKYCVARLGYELINTSKDFSVRIAHPGLCDTNIISNGQTGFNSKIAIKGHKLMTFFTHSPEKGCLSFVQGLVDEDANKPFICPKGLFHLSGYPKGYKLKKYMKKPIIKETKAFLKED